MLGVPGTRNVSAPIAKSIDSSDQKFDNGTISPL